MLFRLEAGCELRAIKLIETLNLPINKEQYAKTANSYLFFYHWALENQSWYNKAPYEIPKIVESMPPKLFDKPQDYINKELMNNEIFTMFNECK